MNPELAAYQNSPHSRVECVECHVAPGAAGWISSKTNGLRQLFETVLNTSPDPFLPPWKAIVLYPREKPARTVTGRRNSAVPVCAYSASTPRTKQIRDRKRFS